MTPAQCRAARDLLDMSEVKLARAADVPIWTLVAFEKGTLSITPHAHISAIRRTLEAAGCHLRGREWQGWRDVEGEWMSPAQCREARALVGMSQAELAALAIVPRTFVADFEAGVMTLMPADLEALKRALEYMGVEFLEDTARLRAGRK